MRLRLTAGSAGQLQCAGNRAAHCGLPSIDVKTQLDEVQAHRLGKGDRPVHRNDRLGLEGQEPRVGEKREAGDPHLIGRRWAGVAEKLVEGIADRDFLIAAQPPFKHEGRNVAYEVHCETVGQYQFAVVAHCRHARVAHCRNGCAEQRQAAPCRPRGDLLVGGANVEAAEHRTKGVHLWFIVSVDPPADAPAYTGVDHTYERNGGVPHPVGLQRDADIGDIKGGCTEVVEQAGVVSGQPDLNRRQVEGVERVEGVGGDELCDGESEQRSHVVDLVADTDRVRVSLDQQAPAGLHGHDCQHQTQAVFGVELNLATEVEHRDGVVAIIDRVKTGLDLDLEPQLEQGRISERKRTVANGRHHLQHGRRVETFRKDQRPRRCQRPAAWKQAGIDGLDEDPGLRQVASQCDASARYGAGAKRCIQQWQIDQKRRRKLHGLFVLRDLLAVGQVGKGVAKAPGLLWQEQREGEHRVAASVERDREQDTDINEVIAGGLRPGQPIACGAAQ